MVIGMLCTLTREKLYAIQRRGGREAEDQPRFNVDGSTCWTVDNGLLAVHISAEYSLHAMISTVTKLQLAAPHDRDKHALWHGIAGLPVATDSLSAINMPA